MCPLACDTSLWYAISSAILFRRAARFSRSFSVWYATRRFFSILFITFGSIVSPSWPSCSSASKLRASPRRRPRPFALTFAANRRRFAAAAVDASSSAPAPPSSSSPSPHPSSSPACFVRGPALALGLARLSLASSSSSSESSPNTTWTRSCFFPLSDPKAFMASKVSSSSSPSSSPGTSPIMCSVALSFSTFLASIDAFMATYLTSWVFMRWSSSWVYLLDSSWLAL